MPEACALVDGWLEQSTALGQAGAPPEHLIEHICGCPRCRGLLVTLAVDLGRLPLDVTDQTCERTAEDLAAFVDHERLHGTLAAARAFPGVWWHTLVCRRCAELAHDLAGLAALPPASPAWQGAPRYPQIELPLAMLHLMAGAEQGLGVAWGEPEADTLLAEQQDELGSVRLAIRRGPAGELLLVVETDPPARGAARLSVGSESYSEPFDAGGRAVFAGLAEALFRPGAGPQLLLRVELAAE